MSSDEDLSDLPALDQVMRLKDGLVARAQGGNFEGGDTAYRELRLALRQSATTYALLPECVRNCSDLSQFWGFIQTRFPTYRERREFLWQEFAPIIDYLEAIASNPAAAPIGDVLAGFDAEGVLLAWERMLNRRRADPEGAITAARTLVETVCKHILDDVGIAYDNDVDLPRLWRLTAEQLNLAPHQHQEPTFRAILGNCQSIVNNLAAIRNTVGDAHGQARRPVRPKPRHAELAVNLAGTMAAFIVATWQERVQRSDAN